MIEGSGVQTSLGRVAASAGCSPYIEWFSPFVAKYEYPCVVNGEWRRSDTPTLVHKPNVQSSMAVICLLIYISSSPLTYPQNPIYQRDTFQSSNSSKKLHLECALELHPRTQ